jgi:hypothetical protein
MKPNRIAAIICWIITVAFTAVFFHTIGELDILVSVALGIVLQAILTIGERPLWRWALKRANGRFALMAVGLTLVDGILNAAGMYNNVPKLSSSGVGFNAIRCVQSTAYYRETSCIRHSSIYRCDCRGVT